MLKTICHSRALSSDIPASQRREVYFFYISPNKFYTRLAVVDNIYIYITPFPSLSNGAFKIVIIIIIIIIYRLKGISTVTWISC